jgi:hypothetical protein
VVNEPEKVCLADAEVRFERMFSAGRLRRMPKGRADTLLFLAVAASVLDPRKSCSEPELNHELETWMADFVDPCSFDHVTVRRYLVDFRLLLRDAPGTRYNTNQTMINHTIEPEVRSIQPGLIFQAVNQAREQRRASRAGDYTV